MPNLQDILSQRKYDAAITAIYVDGALQSGPVRAKSESVTYDAFALSSSGKASILKGSPYNRPYAKASIITARVGDYCDIVVDLAKGKSRLYVHTEREDLRNCQGDPIEDIPS